MKRGKTSLTQVTALMEQIQKDLPDSTVTRTHDGSLGYIAIVREGGRPPFAVHDLKQWKLLHKQPSRRKKAGDPEEEGPTLLSVVRRALGSLSLRDLDCDTAAEAIRDQYPSDLAGISVHEIANCVLTLQEA